MSASIPDLPPATFIRSRADLNTLVNDLHGIPHLALDTEGNSLYAYREQVCLIQLSVNRAGSRDLADMADYIIDPLAIEDMSALGDLLADPQTEVALHGAEYDVMCLKRDFDFRFATLFDTHIAARTLGWRKVGLSSLLERCFDIKLKKKYQTANWAKRPLPEEQIAYAQMDTHFLLNLRHILHDALVKNEYLEEAQELFAHLTQLPPHDQEFDPDGFWRNKHARGLNDQQMAVLRELYLWREKMAEQLDRPPFKVLNDRALVRLVKANPSHIKALYGIKGFPNRWVKHFGSEVIEAIARGQQADPPQPPTHTSPAPEVLARYDALRQWRKERAAQRGVESDIIVSRDVLWTLAHDVPDSPDDLAAIDELGPYRRRQYGQEMLDVLAGVEA